MRMFNQLVLSVVALCIFSSPLMISASTLQYIFPAVFQVDTEETNGELDVLFIGPEESIFENGFIWEADFITERALTRRQEGLDVRGYVPVIDSSFGVNYELLNERIMSVVDELIGEASRARSITFSHSVYYSSYIASVVIQAHVSSAIARTLVRSVNFDLRTGTARSLQDVMGMDILPLTEVILNDRVRRDPERYYAARSANLMTQPFYITNNHLVILFDEFQLSTRIGGIGTIELNIGQIRTAHIEEDDYIMNENGYSLKMVPIRSILNQFGGFEFAWDAENTAATIMRGDMHIIIRPEINEFVIDGITIRQLESAPLLVEGQIFVPITFFDQVLPTTTYTIDNDGSIMFLSYLS